MGFSFENGKEIERMVGDNDYGFFDLSLFREFEGFKF